MRSGQKLVIVTKLEISQKGYKKKFIGTHKLIATAFTTVKLGSKFAVFCSVYI